MTPQERQLLETMLMNVSGEDITVLRTFSDDPEWQEYLTLLARHRAIEELQKLSQAEAHQIICETVAGLTASPVEN